MTRFSIFVLCTLFVLAGCKSTKSVESSLISHDTAVVTRIDTVHTHDTLVVNNEVRDSVVIQTKGDTVYVEKWKIRYKTQDKIVTEYKTKIVRDTVKQYVEKEKQEVKQHATSTKEWLLGIFTTAIFAGLLIFAARKLG
jgi:hypothetical protein